MNNYRANSQLLAAGEIYEEGDLPILVESDIRSNLGNIRDLIRYYIIDAKGGVITNECNNNWLITGNDWDEDLHQKAVEMIASGELSLKWSEDGKCFNGSPITVEDIQ